MLAITLVRVHLPRPREPHQVREREPMIMSHTCIQSRIQFWLIHYLIPLNKYSALFFW